MAMQVKRKLCSRLTDPVLLKKLEMDIQIFIKTYGEKENKKVHFKEIPNFDYFKFYHVFYVMLCCILQKRQYKKSNYKINSE